MGTCEGCVHDDGTNSGIDDFQMVLWTVAGGTSFQFHDKCLDSLPHDSSCRCLHTFNGIDCHDERAISPEELSGFAWILNTQCSLVDGIPLQMVHQPQFVDLLVAAEM